MNVLLVIAKSVICIEENSRIALYSCKDLIVNFMKHMCQNTSNFQIFKDFYILEILHFEPGRCGSDDVPTFNW